MTARPRMTLQVRLVLKIFADAPSKEHYGLEIAQVAGLQGGTIYPLLARLEAAGWLTSGWEEIDPVAAGRRPRRYYRLTSKGAEQLQRITPATWPISSPHTPDPSTTGLC